MKFATVVCLAASVLLAACSSDKNAGDTSGAGGANAAYGQGGGLGSGGGAGARAAPGTEEDLVQSVGDRVYFDTDQSGLAEQSRGTLDRQAAWLRQYPQVSVWIAGNCDERGTQEYNLALGQRRANSARDYLVAHGIAASRTESISYGKARPIDPGTTQEAWARNRNAITSVR
jgi:peptidoglycan-associated lipoprotein